MVESNRFSFLDHRHNWLVLRQERMETTYFTYRVLSN